MRTNEGKIYFACEGFARVSLDFKQVSSSHIHAHADCAASFRETQAASMSAYVASARAPMGAANIQTSAAFWLGTTSISHTSCQRAKAPYNGVPNHGVSE